MVRPKFLGRAIISAVCVIASLLIVETGFVSIASASNPSSVDKYGYAMFKDGDSDWIWSDEKGQYIDYRNNGEDKVLINVNTGNGSLNYIQFYPGKMYQYNSIPSTRSVQFRFNVSGISGQPTGIAVRDILRWYKDGGNYTERSINGWVDDKSLHTPILASSSKFYLNIIQFVVEPNVDNPGTDPKAITLEKVRDYYNQPELNYWYTTDEPAKYIIYTIDYGISEKGKNGFIITPIQWDSKKKPTTWIIKSNPTRTTPVKLSVKTPDFYGQTVVLAQYTNVPFELAVSLNPLSSYPVYGSSLAPGKNRNASTTWGEIKGK